MSSVRFSKILKNILSLYSRVFQFKIRLLQRGKFDRRLGCLIVSFRVKEELDYFTEDLHHIPVFQEPELNFQEFRNKINDILDKKCNHLLEPIELEQKQKQNGEGEAKVEAEAEVEEEPVEKPAEEPVEEPEKKEENEEKLETIEQVETVENVNIEAENNGEIENGTAENENEAGDT